MKAIHWNGTDLPNGLQTLPPGRYVLQSVDDVAVLTPEEERRIRAALESLDDGKGLSQKDVRDRVTTLLNT